MTANTDRSRMSDERLRAEALAAARRFKNTWIEFGAVLIQVRDRASWRAWGFDSFEAYCAKELHIRQKTAQKLTASYGFLMKHEPEIAASESRLGLDALRSESGSAEEMAEVGESAVIRPVRNMPAFQTISVLADAEERGQLSDDDYASLRERIWGEGGSSPDLAREITQRFAEPKPPRPIDLTLRRFSLSARRLADGLSGCQAIPDDVKAKAESLAQTLAELAESAEQEDGEADRQAAS